MTSVFHEPAREVRVAADCDLCVIGGSCTGVFAAVRAARLGASVCLVEASGFFGGVATAGLVNYWHSYYDTQGEIQIIGGLTQEVTDRLNTRGAVEFFEKDNPNAHAALNTEELKLELDRLVVENKIRPFLHARFCAPIMEGERCAAAVIEDKTGRRAIRAKYFIDASGDGDLIHRMGLPTQTLGDLQPPTTCAMILGIDEVEAANPGFNLKAAVTNPEFPQAIEASSLWASRVVGIPGARMVAGARVNNADCSDADQLTHAEIEGRRQVGAMLEILRTHFKNSEHIALGALPSYTGVRETRHALCEHTVTEMELLEGVAFPDAIGYGSYRIDVHHSDGGGLTFRYLDGRETRPKPGGGGAEEETRWREPREVDPTYYQIPYRCLIPLGSRNVLVAGRLMSADRGAFGALRVMVNCNQTGEAAGVACALAANDNCAVGDVSPETLRDTLKAGGSILL